MRYWLKTSEANPVEASINAFYIAIPGHKILVDTGSGQLFGPGKGGRLIESPGDPRASNPKILPIF